MHLPLVFIAQGSYIKRSHDGPDSHHDWSLCRVAGWSSPVARQAHNLKVAGSNPAPATKVINIIQLNQCFVRIVILGADRIPTISIT